MRLWIVTAFLCAGPAALSQSVAPAPAHPEPHPTAPTGSAGQSFVEQFLAPPANDFLNHPSLNRPPQWHAADVAPQRTIILPPTGDVRIRDNKLDPQIIVHPPQSSLGEQSPGKEIAQNQYPGLTLLPIQSPQPDHKPLGLPIPTTWPNMRVENIPTHWQQDVIKPAGK